MNVHGTIEGATLTGMEFGERGKKIQRRRLAHGFRSVREFQERVHEDTGLSREAITKAEKGTASAGTYQRLEAWLDAFDHETGEDMPADQGNGGNVRYTISGNFGVGVVVEGPVEVAAELEASAMRIVAQMQSPTPAPAPEPAKSDPPAEVDPAVYAEMRKVGRLSKSRPRNPVAGQDH